MKKYRLGIVFICILGFGNTFYFYEKGKLEQKAEVAGWTEAVLWHLTHNGYSKLEQDSSNQKHFKSVLGFSEFEITAQIQLVEKNEVKLLFFGGNMGIRGRFLVFALSDGVNGTSWRCVRSTLNEYYWPRICRHDIRK